jgi:hypothetical protein
MIAQVAMAAGMIAKRLIDRIAGVLHQVLRTGRGQQEAGHREL